MITEIDDDRDSACFTFIWAIENYGILHGIFYGILYSPSFSVGFLENTRWTLSLVEEGMNTPIGCQIDRYDRRGRFDGREEYIHVNFDLAILGAEGMPLVTKSGEKSFHGLISSSEWLDLIDKIALHEQKEKFLPNDTFTLRCRLWMKNSSISRSDICFARTVLGVENREFFWTNKEFSQLQPGQRRSLLVQPLQKGVPTMELTLYLKQTSGEDSVVFEVNYEGDEFLNVGAKISLMGPNGQLGYTESKGAIVSQNSRNLKIEPLIRKAALLMDERRYLLNDTLVLRCELKLCFGEVLSRIENYGYGLTTTVESWLLADSKSDLKIRKETSYNLDSLSNSKNFNGVSESCCSFCPLKRTMERSIDQGILPDMCLKNGKKSFFVHKNILKKKSNVFKKMTGQNVATKSIDLDSQCLHHLQTYIDTGTVGDLKREVVFDVLEAAKVYKLTDLEEICSQFLGSYSSPSNVHGGLTPPVNHQDKKPKKRIRHFIFDAISSSFF
ncbi:hypothetical protein AVEN_82203-1 [Araneus ventricosus]|uniref:BTB domain-containing protein n=1 Tax=Araneus ventricosus TaxID=182803 RepID=A0A4Y2JL76_ARAVE|nr:hypothetical protein AVEN_82203-1 [Araneus ventricosus]